MDNLLILMEFIIENNHDSMCMKGPASDDDDSARVEKDDMESESVIAKNIVTTNRCSQQSNTIYMNRTGLCVPLCHSNNNGYTKV